MVLTDKQIRVLCEEKNMIFPFEENNLQSESYDLSIGNFVYVSNNNLRELDLKSENTIERLFREIEILDSGFLLGPKEYILISLKEKLTIPENINAHIRPRTRFTRAGILVNTQHLNSTYSGILRIGLCNLLNIPIRIYRDLKICQIVFDELKEVPTIKKQYRNKENATYQNEKDFISSKLDPELKKKVKEALKRILGD